MYAVKKRHLQRRLIAELLLSFGNWGRRI